MMKEIWRTAVHGPWPYWVGAMVLGGLNILVLLVRKRPWGVTSNLQDWAVWLAHLLGLASERIPVSQLLLAEGTYLNLGVVLGALWAALAASQWRFRPLRQRKFGFSALIGGLFLGYGARIAYGCNVGGLLNGIASSSLTGWVFALAVFLGTWIGAKILLKFLV
ncbi:MAG: YeeE/YedE thiosulfate transporter family protein [Desulfitobacteriaceae bacterium]|nr:YeeE/YedE thiosulfate transporter family protein [Desulfitobacteriaceae bacterium]MDI6878527.1 YeeE/YedE thiosulfate transporter family protein [Desulfitobacteriaceae bacterium]MDI6914657.1 YeeE/YedE thiosulfate transporter family protein [Desulfitobacteriaceae bacterium]